MNKDDSKVKMQLQEVSSRRDSKHNTAFTVSNKPDSKHNANSNVTKN